MPFDKLYFQPPPRVRTFSTEQKKGLRLHCGVSIPIIIYSRRSSIISTTQFTQHSSTQHTHSTKGFYPYTQHINTYTQHPTALFYLDTAPKHSTIHTGLFTFPTRHTALPGFEFATTVIPIVFPWWSPRSILTVLNGISNCTNTRLNHFTAFALLVFFS